MKTINYLTNTNMRKINELISSITYFQIKATDTLELYDYLEKNNLKAMGFGQDRQTAGTSPEYAVYELEESIEYKGEKYNVLSVDFSNDEVYIQESFADACSNATEDDGWGEGYEI